MSIDSNSFSVDKSSVRSTIVKIAANQKKMTELLNQFENVVGQTEEYWENSFTASFRKTVTTYIKNVRTKQEQLTENLTAHLSVVISSAESTEKTVSSNASLFDT